MPPAPTKGGTLKLLGTSDIFNLDTVSAYYTVSSLLERTFTRQLVSYPNAATFPASIKIVPDIATAVPTKGNGISADGKTYTFKLRSGVQWNTTPARAVTAADFVLEFKMLCNPAAPNAAPGYFTSTIVGHEGLLRRLRQGQGHRPGDRGLRQGPSARRRRRQGSADARVQAAQPCARLPQHPRHGLLLGAARRVHEVRARRRADAPAHALRRALRDHEVRAEEVDDARPQPRLEREQRPAAQGLRRSHRDHRGAELRRASSSSSRRARATWSGTSSRRRRICRG